MRDVSTDADAGIVAGFRRRPLWALVLLALTLAQAATTLTLFDPDCSARSLRDERPILSGAHPLHLYHGLLGARSWRDGGFGSCYDPAFQAGYPKTPVFDSGSRPGELFLLLGRDHPAAYKIGLAVCCALVPLIFAASARLLELRPATACLAALLGILTWWGGPVQRLLERGQTDWLFAGLVLVLHAALTVRFHRAPSVIGWFGLALTAALGWFLHPILWVGFGFLFVPFFVGVATGHGLVWNLALLGAWAAGFFLNIGWLDDWVRFCWIQVPLPISARETIRVSLEQWFAADVGGGHADRSLAALLLGGGLVGVVGFLARRRVAAGLTFGATALVLPALSLGSGAWKPLEAIGVAKLFVLACAFATVPCAAAFTDVNWLLGRLTRHPVRGGALMLTLVVVGVFCFRDDAKALARQARQAKPLAIGLSRDQQALVRTIRAASKPEARILWEERPSHPTPGWSALLPLHTGRSFLGGLDPELGVDHAHARLTSTQLAGRVLEDWTDREFADFCERYNVGYVVCWTPAVVERFRSWPVVTPLVPLHEWGDGWLLAVNRDPSFVLKGKARVAQLDAGRIALADVEPEDGVVVLSLHYQDGFRITPGTVTAERDPDPDDPIPRLRLRLPGPTLRVTLTWGRN
jgi:hypothetical protein